MILLKKSFLCAVLMYAARALWAQDGALDPTFNPGDGGFGLGDGTDPLVYALAVQPDGRSLIGGSFFTYNANPSRGVARVNSDGTWDSSFDVGLGAQGYVQALTMQTDGKIIVAGQFNNFDQIACGNLVRLNTNGTVDPSFVTGVGATFNVQCATIQPNGKILIGGAFTTYDGVARNRLARLNADGTLDATFNVGSGFSGGFDMVYAIAVQTDGKIIVVGTFEAYNGTATSNIVRLNSNGTIDPFFATGTGTENTIYGLAVQSDGRIIIAGGFSTYNGSPRSGVARLTSTGALDATFDPGSGTNGRVTSVKLQTDGKVLLGGEFTSVAGIARSRIARLNANGTVDMAFDPGIGADDVVNSIAMRPDGKVVAVGAFRRFNGRGCGRMVLLNTTGAMDINHNPVNGVNGIVDGLAQQADGKILIGGDFTGVNGEGRKCIARLHANGTLDTSFDPGTGADWPVLAFAVQPDAKIIAAGGFVSYNGTTVKRIVRLSTTGAIDPTFNTAVGVNSTIYDCLLQPDGKVLICGHFTSFNGTSRNRIARLNADGTLDGTFDPGGGADNWIGGMILQTDGKIVICGSFTTYNGTARKHLARLSANGSLDPTFDPGTGAGGSGTVIDNMSMLPDGRIVVAGSFTTYGGVNRSCIARVNANGGFDASFDPGSGLNNYTLYTSIAVPDGKVIIGGSFTTYNGISRKGIARVNLDGSLDMSFDPGTGTYSISKLLLKSDGDLLAGGGLFAYNGTGRNRIARINGTARAGIRVLLHGPYAGSLMNDALRTLPSFPLAEPFTAMGYSHSTYVPGATISSSVLSVTGNNAIVDWLLIEMRPAASPSTIAASRAVLLQRDGDVVDLDGVSTVGFAGLAAGTYCVAVRPRNHLPVMLSPSTPITYGDAIATVDFTLPGTQVYDNDARTNIAGTMVLPAGDVTFDGTVKYAGSNNDRDPILTRIGGTVPTATVSGYWREDANMDGVVKYAGSNNDRDRILNSIGGSVPTATRVAPLP